MRVDCAKLPLLRREIFVGGVKSLPSSHLQVSSLVLSLKQKDKRNTESGIFMTFLTSSVDLIHYSQGHLIRSLFLVKGVVVLYILNRLNLLGLT